MLFRSFLPIFTHILLQVILSYQLVENKSTLNELRFIAIGDFGYTAKDGGVHAEQAKVGRFVSNQAMAANYDFIVALGDSFYPNGLESPMDRKAEVLLEDTFQISQMDLDWYAVVGNHDMRSELSAALGLKEKFPLWKQTEPYYSKIANIGDSQLKAGFIYLHSSELVCLNASDRECYPSMHKNIEFDGIQAQLDWLDSTLSEMSDDDDEIIWKIVVTHNPIFSAGITHGDCNVLKQALLPILRKYKVDLVLTGHDHSAQYLRMDMNDEDRQDRPQEAAKAPVNCSSREFILGSAGNLGELSQGFDVIRESVSVQHEYMHHFVLGNGGIHVENICPNKQQNSQGELVYGVSKAGFGDVRITETEIQVNLMLRNEQSSYQVKIQRQCPEEPEISY